jgi:hypothetical protein
MFKWMHRDAMPLACQAQRKQILVGGRCGCPDLAILKVALNFEDHGGSLVGRKELVSPTLVIPGRRSAHRQSLNVGSTDSMAHHVLIVNQTTACQA